MFSYLLFLLSDYQQHARLALRCNIARVLLGESFRDFSAHLADSALLQWFCQRQEIDRRDRGEYYWHSSRNARCGPWV